MSEADEKKLYFGPKLCMTKARFQIRRRACQFFRKYHHMQLSRALLTAVSVFGLLAASHQAKADLITDGMFLNTSLSSPGGYICAQNPTPSSVCHSNLTSWSATCSSYGCFSNSTPSSLLFAGSDGNLTTSAFDGGGGLYGTIANPPGGGNVVALDGGSGFRTTIFQTVSGLVVGDRYELDFYQGAGQQRARHGATTEQWEVTLGSDTDYGTLMNNPSGGVTPWNAQALDFIASSTSEVLTFMGLGGPSGQPPVALLADVSLTDIPEPGTVALVGLGLLGTLVFARRKATARAA